MRNLKRWLIVLAVLLCCAAGIVLCLRGYSNAHRPTIDKIRERGALLVGTTGDYRPLSYLEKDGGYWGLCIDVAERIAEELNVPASFVPTSWPTLTADVLQDPQRFDLAIGGIPFGLQHFKMAFSSIFPFGKVIR